MPNTVWLCGSASKTKTHFAHKRFRHQLGQSLTRYITFKGLFKKAWTGGVPRKDGSLHEILTFNYHIPIKPISVMPLNAKTVSNTQSVEVPK